MHTWEDVIEKCSLTKLFIDRAQPHKGTVHIKQGLNGVLSHSSDRQTDTHDLVFAFFLPEYLCWYPVTSLLTDPEVFLMLLHNSVLCCIATLRVSLYVTGEGFQRGEIRWIWLVVLMPVLLLWLSGPTRELWLGWLECCGHDGLMDSWTKDWW